jgi:hypothetical protein
LTKLWAVTILNKDSLQELFEIADINIEVGESSTCSSLIEIFVQAVKEIHVDICREHIQNSSPTLKNVFD